MKRKHRRSTSRAIRRAVHGGLSRLRKQSLSTAAGHARDERLSSTNGSHHDAGILRPDTGYLRLPESLAEAGDAESESTPVWAPGPVVLTIAGGAIVFIAIIAWFVSQMPGK